MTLILELNKAFNEALNTAQLQHANNLGLANTHNTLGTGPL